MSNTIEKLNELNVIAKDLEKVNEYIKRSESIGFDLSAFDSGLYVLNSDNGRYTLRKLASVIGDEQLNQAIGVFKDVIAARLNEVKAQKEADLARYEISKV